MTAARLLMPAALALGGCAPAQSALAPRGPAAERIADLGWFMIAAASLFSAVVIGLLLYPVLRAWRRGGEGPPHLVNDTAWIVLGGALAPAVILVVVYLLTLRVLAAVGDLPGAGALVIEVTGRQWWWDVRYPGDGSDPGFVTANEIHVPVGRPVVFRVASADVIHSFWVPRLHGKIDMVPGKVNTIALTAAEPGVYRGQCAEFCGVQHALMAFHVVAEPPEAFAAWAARQREPAAPPTEPFLDAGRRLFMSGPCVFCHAIRGTPAVSTYGPDLTHVGSRLTIAAGTMPNTIGNLEAWIVDAQGLKPGNLMPSFNLFTGVELQALAAYLESLK